MNRINNYNKLNVQLNYISDDEIIKIIGKSKKSGFSANTTIEIDKIKIFVKFLTLSKILINLIIILEANIMIVI